MSNKKMPTARFLEVLEFSLRVAEVVDVKEDVRNQFKVLVNKIIKRVNTIGGDYWYELPLSKEEQRLYAELESVIIPAAYSRADKCMKSKGI